MAMSASLGSGLVYRGVDLGVALRSPLYGGLLGSAIKSLTLSHELRPTCASCDIAIVYSYLRSGRADYIELVDNLVSYLEGQSAELLLFDPTFSIRDMARVWTHLVRSLPQFRLLQGGMLDKSFLICMIARAKSNVDLVFDFLDASRIRVLVTFCDAQEVDNIVTQCARLRDIKTVTLQHGQYCISDSDIPENLALRNLTSEYLCGWGQATVDEAAKVNNDLTVVRKTGSLKSYAEDRVFYESSDFAIARSGHTICVLLNADNCYESNCALIELANEYCSNTDSSYCVRYHPRNRRRKYEELYRIDCYREYREEDAGSIEFHLVYTSGVFVEMLARRALFFFYVDEETPDLFRINEIMVQSSEMLMNRIEWIRNSSSSARTTYNAISAYFLEPGNARVSYAEFFSKLVNEDVRSVRPDGDRQRCD